MKSKSIKLLLASCVIVASAQAISAQAPVTPTQAVTIPTLNDAFATQSEPGFAILSDVTMKQVSGAGCFSNSPGWCFSLFPLGFSYNWTAKPPIIYSGPTNNQPYNPSCVNGTITRRVC